MPGLLNSRSIADTPSWARDKAVVLLFLQGGPPQVECFDPNMDAPSGVRSCIGEISTKLPGVTFGSAFPQLAERADRLSIVRSFASGDAGHNPDPLLTGNSPLKATMGAHHARLVGANHPETAMPSSVVVLPEGIDPELKLGTPTGPFRFGFIKQHYGQPGQLGSPYQSLFLDGGDQLAENFDLKLPRDRFDDRRLLLGQLDSFRQRLQTAGARDGLGEIRSQAYDVLLKGISEAFDLTKEDTKTLRRYDTRPLFRMEDWHKGGSHYNNKVNQSRITNLLGHQMLMARRLVERGCGFVTVVDCTWDFHNDGNNPATVEGMNVLGPQADHAIAAFMDDLEDRGLTDKVLLLVTGEMGRSPKKQSNGGTGHWGRLTPLLVAGGGLKMGQVIGKTDRNGGEATTKQYLPQHLLATILQTVFDPGEARLDSSIPTDLARLMTVGEPIRELFA
jgi:hypothetical protein|tara:strand:- start:479 stop:1822 length:1344 start_codon:yes stop_codon:yes gene_type:complete